MEIIRRLGNGNYSVVYLVNDEDGNQYVYKHLEHVADPGSKYQSSESEIEFHMKAAKKYLDNEVRIVQVLYPDRIFKVTPDGTYFNYYPDFQELYKFCSEVRVDRVASRFKFAIMINILKELSLIHGLGVAHRDIKSENILFSMDTLEVHFIDFGFSCRESDEKDRYEYPGSPIFNAPELIRAHEKREQLSWDQLKAIDIWGLGHVFIDLCLDIEDSRYDNFKTSDILLDKLPGMVTELVKTPKDAIYAEIIVKLFDQDWKNRTSVEPILEAVINAQDRMSNLTESSK